MLLSLRVAMSKLRIACSLPVAPCLSGTTKTLSIAIAFWATRLFDEQQARVPIGDKRSSLRADAGEYLVKISWWLDKWRRRQGGIA